LIKSSRFAQRRLLNDFIPSQMKFLNLSAALCPQ